MLEWNNTKCVFELFGNHHSYYLTVKCLVGILWKLKSFYFFSFGVACDFLIQFASTIQHAQKENFLFNYLEWFLIALYSGEFNKKPIGGNDDILLLMTQIDTTIATLWECSYQTQYFISLFLFFRFESINGFDFIITLKWVIHLPLNTCFINYVYCISFTIQW